MAEDAAHLDQRHLDGGEALDLAQREIDHAVFPEGIADDDVLRRRAAAQFHHQSGREFEPRHHEGRIDAALEAIARIRIDAELAAGLGNIDLVPQRRFDQDISGLFVAAGALAAHNAGHRLHAMIVRDHADAGIERVGAAVERQQTLAVARAPHGEIARHFFGVEHMQRPGTVVGHEIGDIDQRIDRAQSDRGQALLQPFRRRAVLDTAHQSQREARTQRGVFHRHLHRAGEFALDRLDGGVLELAHVGGGKIARNAVHAGAILPVRGQVDFQNGIAEPGPLRVSRTNGRIGRQLHDAVMVFGNLQFGRRAQHAAAFDAADGADAERDVLAGNERAGRGEYADQPCARVWRAADHLHRCSQALFAFCAGIDHADAQAIRIRMLFGRNHPRNRKRRQRLRLVVDMLDLKPDHGELVGKLFQRLVGVEMFLQPGECEFHDGCFSCPLSRLRGRVKVGALSASVASMRLTCSVLPPASGRRAV